MARILHGGNRATQGAKPMGSRITLTAADGHRLDAWRSGPEHATRGLVVAQEIFGVNRYIRAVCEEFAEAGFAVIAPTLFDRAERGVELGYTAEDVPRGVALRARVPESGTLADIEAAALALGVNGPGIVGYCWGGTVAWWAATRCSRFRAAVGWYGGGIAASRSATPNCRVQLHFGATDASIPLGDVEAIRAAQPWVEIYVYPGVGHGFGCSDRPSYNEAAFRLAQSRTLGFFAKYLAA
jgi:carboxymethylenebutenolidase